MKATFTTLILLTACLRGFAQQRSADDLTVINRTASINNDGTAPVIHLNAEEGAGIAWIKGVTFTKGSIEVDIKGKDVLQQSFVGIALHGTSGNSYEAIYFRPFNFRSADPVRKSHAVQYIAIPGYDWQKLRTEHPGQYEKAVVPVPDPNRWFHARIEADGTTIRVYVNHNTSPSLTVTEPVQTGGTMIGYWAGNYSDGNWKNLEIKFGK
ncbi:MAG TPA: hypothetical protein VHC47_04860 [Mucilaginibacter sp.]|nr:hypothetical protein [Mucilaginibacter sp.]